MGSTHDSTAWGMSMLGMAFENGELPAWAYFVADDAYTSSEQMLVPYGGRGISEAKDAFNYFQSSLRIEVECTLGALQARWGVLWRPLRTSLSFSSKVVMACACLHNICVDAGMAARAQDIALCGARNDADGTMRVRRRDGVVVDQEGAIPPSLYPRFQSAGYSVTNNVGRGPNAPSTRVSSRRDEIMAAIERRGLIRPPHDRRHGRPRLS
jgi:hypothetical protein